MKKKFTVGLAGILLVALLAPVIQAETKWTLSGQSRIRGMNDKTGFDTTAVFDNYVEMRTRFNVQATVDDNTTAFIQFQDSRVWGGYNMFGTSQSGTLNDAKNIDVHQAYVKVDNLFGKRWGAQAGRFEFNQGNQRVFGAVGWDNVSRSWDGAMFGYDHDKFKLNLTWLKSVENRDPGYDRDFDLLGLFGNYKEMNLQWFAVLEMNKDTTGLNTNIKKLNRYDLGLYYQRAYQQFDFEMNTVYQLGTMAKSASTEYDISALLFTFETGYSFEGEKNVRVAAGIDYSSGQSLSDSLGTDWKAYNNLYYTGHKFRGYMDYFVTSGMSGLMDLMLRGKFDPIKGWTIKGDLHLFSTAQEYFDPLSTNNATTKDVGTEIDITISTKRVAGINLDVGLSYFIAKDAFAGMINGDPGLWSYTMATVNF